MSNLDLDKESLAVQQAREQAHRGQLSSTVLRENMRKRMSGYDAKNARILSDPCNDPNCPACGTNGTYPTTKKMSTWGRR